MWQYNVELRDENGIELKNGDKLLVKDGICDYVGTLTKNMDFGVHMLKAEYKKYKDGRRWHKISICEEWVPLTHRNKGIFRKRLKGVYLKERVPEEPEIEPIYAF